MYLAYIDESGDMGLINSPTTYFVLSCVLIHESRWLDTLDSLVSLRRQVSSIYSIPTQVEIKATDLIHGKGLLRSFGLTKNKRLDLYKSFIKFQDDNIDSHVFAIAIHKANASVKGWNPRTAAWTFLIQRLNKFCGDSERVMLFPDEGHSYFIRRLLREMRRYHYVPAHFGGSPIYFPTTRIIEDPNSRKSHESYFIQLADWNAYIAHRSKYIDPNNNVPNDLWDKLGSVLLHDVNKVTGGPPAIVKYP